jgi:hypothetical protein
MCRLTTHRSPCPDFFLAPTTRSGLAWDITRDSQRWVITRSGPISAITLEGTAFSRPTSAFDRAALMLTSDAEDMIAEADASGEDYSNN